MLLVAILAGATAMAAAVQPKAEAETAYDRYAGKAAQRIRAEEGAARSFLTLESEPAEKRAADEARLREGEVLTWRAEGTPSGVPGGLIHDWSGMAFLRGATTQEVMQVVQDYDHLARHYGPEVEESRLVRREGDRFSIAMRMREHKVITVVLDSDYEVQYGRLDATHLYSDARSTRIQEIAEDGKSDEHAVAEADSHGFLWRLDTHWRFEQASDGVYVECEAISLTRDVPTGLGWLIEPFIRDLPGESLRLTLTQTRDAVAGER